MSWRRSTFNEVNDWPLKKSLVLTTMFKGQWPSSRPSQKSLTFHAWSQLPGKANLFEQLSKLKRKKANKDQGGGGGVGSGGSSHLLQSNKPEWSNSAAEKSVRFTLPPSEVRSFSLYIIEFCSNRNGIPQIPLFRYKRFALNLMS